MKINNEEIDINDIIDITKLEKNFLKVRNNGIMLSDEQIEVLNRYNIDYNKYYNIEQLIYEIEEELNNGFGSDDLEWLQQELAERNYYQNTNK